MRKCDFNNRMSLQGADNINTVIAPSVCARSSNLRISNVIKGLIGRSLDDCLRNRGMTVNKNWRKRGMSYILLILISSVSMAAMVRAECSPTPNCAEIGYTATSCDGKFTRCPFDTSKLFCVPCDSSYKYSCNGSHITQGIGNHCGGKYISCECETTYNFIDGQCCNSNCVVGSILYSDMSCSSCVLSNKTAIGIVSHIKENSKIAITLEPIKMSWSGDLVAILPAGTFPDINTAKADFNGKEHTIAIVNHYGIASTNVAAAHCFNYRVAGMATGQWYLPAGGELYASIYTNKNTINSTLQLLGKPAIDEGYHWSSSEYNNRNSWGAYPSGAFGNDTTKQSAYNITCVIEF